MPNWAPNTWMYRNLGPTAGALSTGGGGGASSGGGMAGAGGYSAALPASLPGGTTGGARSSSYAGAGGGAAAPAAAPAPMQTSPIPSYQPRPQPAQVASQITQTGQGLLDPNSDYMKQLRELLSGTIGEDVEANKRLAAFEAAQSGYGTGESAELMANLADIGAAGTEAYGKAVGETALQGPQMGLEALQAALQGELGISGQDLQAWQALQSLQEQQREAAMGSAYQGRELDLQQQQLANQSMWNQLALLFG